MAGASNSLGRALNFARRLRIARARYGRSYPALLRDFIDLNKRQGYTPKEIFTGDLLGWQPGREVRETALSKAALIAIQQRLNPYEASLLVEDKSLFYSYCNERGLPVPRLLALWEPGRGRTAEGMPLCSDEDWVAYLKSLDARDIVIKPALGVYGRGIRFLRRSGEQWRDHQDRILAGADVVRGLRQDREFDRFVVQERVIPHSRLVELSGSEYVQSVRIITGVGKAASAGIYITQLMVICGSAAISNFAWGATGNGWAVADEKTGTLAVAFVARSDGVGVEPIERHPVTRMPFAGFVVPFWDETLELCRRAALEFLPLRTVGWDVAVTAAGPLLLEGNAWWDPHSPQRIMGPFMRYAQTMLNVAA